MEDIPIDYIEISEWRFDIIKEKMLSDVYKNKDKARDLSHALFLLDELYKNHGLDAVITALRREINLRERSFRRGGRPNIVKKYMRIIDRIFTTFHDKEVIEMRIDDLLDEVKMFHSKATYYKVKKYARKKLEELS